MSFSLPIKTDWMKDQMDHKPSRTYAEEIYNLVKTFPYESALEIGSAWGVSALAILTAQPKGHLTAVDKSDQTKLWPEIEANKLEDRCTFHIQPSSEFWQQNQKKFDLIYVDGSHLYEDVHNDLFEAWKVLKDNGLIFWDDFTHPANRTVDDNGKYSEYGVSLASWELIKEMKITRIHTTTRLLCVYKAEQ